MKPLSRLNDFLNAPDFWMLLLCDEIMGEDRFREFLESMKNEETSDMLEKGKQVTENYGKYCNLSKMDYRKHQRIRNGTIKIPLKSK